MNIRGLEPRDMFEIQRLHNLYFKDEFELPDFLNYLCAFIVEDDRGIITVGGVRDIAELIAVTNKSRAPQTRIKALYQMLDMAVSISQGFEYDQLHAFVQGHSWSRRAQRSGFRPTKGQALVLDI